MWTIPYDYYVSVSEDNNIDTSQSIENSSIGSGHSIDYFEGYQSDSIEPIFDLNINNELYERMAEGIRNSIDSGILENIINVQPMGESLSEIFYFDVVYTDNKRKKLDLRLPDELFEME